MSTSATLKHEEEFERHLVGLVGGGFAAGLVAAVLELIVGREVQALTALSFAAVVGLCVNLLDPREDTALVRLLLALVGGVLMGGLAQTQLLGANLWAAVAGGGFLGAALTFDRQGGPGWRRWMTRAGFGAALAAGVFTTTTLLDAGLLGPLDVPILRDAAVGMCWGLFLAVAAGASDLRWERDAVGGRLDAATASHAEPVTDYLTSARELYRQIVRECERAEQDDTRRRARDIAVETVESLLRLGSRFEELESTLTRAGGDRLERRLERLSLRFEQTEDPQVRRELAQARREVREQLGMRGRLDSACARLEARLQRCVTTLEKLHLTLVQHAASAGSDVGLADSLSRLEQLVEEVELKSLSVDELCAAGQGEPVEDRGSPMREQPAASARAAAGWDGELDVSLAASDGESSAPQDPQDPPDQDEQRHEQVVCDPNSSC